MSCSSVQLGFRLGSADGGRVARCGARGAPGGCAQGVSTEDAGDPMGSPAVGITKVVKVRQIDELQNIYVVLEIKPS